MSRVFYLTRVASTPNTKYACQKEGSPTKTSLSNTYVAVAIHSASYAALNYYYRPDLRFVFNPLRIKTVLGTIDDRAWILQTPVQFSHQGLDKA